MALPSQYLLSDYLVEVELPEEVALVDPDDGFDPYGEALLRAFLRDFEDKNELLEDIGLFPANADQ